MNQTFKWLDPSTWVVLNIQWANSNWWIWVLAAMAVTGLFAAYNLRVQESTRGFWGDRLVLNEFSPRTRNEGIRLWIKWMLVIGALVTALFSPNMTDMPQVSEAGSVQLENVFDTSPSEAAEDTRAFYAALSGEKDPGPDYQYGTRLDTNVALFKRDLLPQLRGNKAGIITVEGAGYDMWDITSDLSKDGALQSMLKYVKPLAAPGAGSDYTSGINAALYEFDLIAGLEKKAGDTADKVRFIALWTDGGFTGDEKQLNVALDKLVERKIRLLVVDTAGSQPMTVPKYDVRTHRRSKESYEGLTASEPKILERMVTRMKGLGTLILAQQPTMPIDADMERMKNDGTLVFTPFNAMEIKYSIPQKAGGQYSHPSHSNLTPYLVLFAVALLLSITTGGGGWPRLRYFLPTLRSKRVSQLSAAFVSIKSRFGFGQKKGKTP